MEIGLTAIILLTKIKGDADYALSEQVAIVYFIFLIFFPARLDSNI